MKKQIVFVGPERSAAMSEGLLAGKLEGGVNPAHNSELCVVRFQIAAE
jgi:hypothetical protein